VIKAKVIHIITKMELGGAQENTLFTVSHLNPEKFKTFLVIGKDGEMFEEAKAFKNTSVVPDLIREIRPIKDIRAFFQIAKAIKKIKLTEPESAPTIVHTHSSKAGIIGRWAAKASGIPIIIHSMHGFGFNDYQHFWGRRFFILLEQITSRITTKFIAVSSANIEKGVQLNIFPREKTGLIRSGIDISRFQNPAVTKQEMRKNLEIPDDVPVVAMISCLKPQKAPLDYVRACDLVKKEVPDAHFLLIGDGVLRGAVEKEIYRMNLRNCFRLLGWRRDIPEILHATNVLALTSLWEGLPKVLPQAMAAGVCIVATRVDGSPEAVRDGVNGFLVSPGDVSGLAEKVTFLLKDPAKASEMGKRGFELVGEFDINKMVIAQEKLYEELPGVKS
jgi:glycosyltransferase involved in cell wall biosynthesis